MNAVEIEAAISEVALQPFDRAEFPFSFLASFGNKETTLKRLRKGDSNASDISGGVLQRNNIHIAVAEPGQVGEVLAALRASPRTDQAKAKFILATDGIKLEAEDLISGETIACDYPKFPDHFGFFLPLAGISTIKEIKDKLAGINRVKMENVFHKIFSPAQLDLEIQDRFGNPVKPREWFLVPLAVIDEAVERIKNRSIEGMIYDPKVAKLVSVK